MVLVNYLEPDRFVPYSWNVKEWSSHKPKGYVTRTRALDGTFRYLWKEGSKVLAESPQWSKIKRIAEEG